MTFCRLDPPSSRSLFSVPGPIDKCKRRFDYSLHFHCCTYVVVHVRWLHGQCLPTWTSVDRDSWWWNPVGILFQPVRQRRRSCGALFNLSANSSGSLSLFSACICENMVHIGEPIRKVGRYSRIYLSAISLSSLLELYISR